MIMQRLRVTRSIGPSMNMHQANGTKADQPAQPFESVTVWCRAVDDDESLSFPLARGGERLRVLPPPESRRALLPPGTA